MDFEHYSVMLNETIESLNLKSCGIYYDGTLGGGGHTEKILQSTKDAVVIGVDRDAEAIQNAKLRLAAYGDRLTVVHDNFKNILNILKTLNIDSIDGAVLDLGVSSYQLDNFDRGFSYRNEDSPLDMRMNKDDTLTAYDILNGYSEAELTRIFFEFGEERFSKKIAANIVSKRAKEPIRTCGELNAIIKACIPMKLQMTGGHPSKRVYQAIRIEVNRELEKLDCAIYDIVSKLKKGARLAVITFHSLEDRIVKHAFKYLESDCICDKSMPICTCGKIKEGRVVTSKPMVASERELDENSRSQSAKLRVFEKI